MELFEHPDGEAGVVEEEIDRKRPPPELPVLPPCAATLGV